MAPGIPSQAVGVSVVILLYSSICLSLSTMLTCLLISFGEAWSYVTIFSGFTALSTAASIAQQLHYATSWVIIKQAQFDKAVLALTQKGLAFGGAAQIVDQVLFFIQFYCYNVMALNILFWTVALFTGSWGIRSKWLGDWHERVAPISKVFSVLFPGLIIGLINVPAIQRSAGLFIFITYVGMFSSLSMGSILLVLILYKYMKTRRLVSGYSRRGRWWASGSSKDRSDNRSGNRSENDIGTRYTAETAGASRRSIYDRALITRFSIGFVILALFEVAIIVFTLFQANNNAAIAASGQPDHSVSGTITDIVLFIPGVTASLVAFLVFGTTKNWRQYRDLLTGGCGLRKKMIIKKVRRAEEAARPQGLEFERLPSLQKHPSEEERQKGKEAIDRVRMFVKEIGRDDSSNEGEGSGSLGPSEAQAVQFHRPMPSLSYSRSTADAISPISPIASRSRQTTVTALSPTSRHNISNSIDVGLSFGSEDQVIQYENLQQRARQNSETSQQEPRRFVMERLPQTQQHKQTDFIESDSSE